MGILYFVLPATSSNFVLKYQQLAEAGHRCYFLGVSSSIKFCGLPVCVFVLFFFNNALTGKIHVHAFHGILVCFCSILWKLTDR